MSDPNNTPVDPGGVGQPTGTESPTDAPSAPSDAPNDTPDPDLGDGGAPAVPNPTPEDHDEADYQRYKRNQERYERERDNPPEPPPVVDEGQVLDVGNNGNTGDGDPTGTPEGTTQDQPPPQRVRQSGFRGRGRRRYTSV